MGSLVVASSSDRALVRLSEKKEGPRGETSSSSQTASSSSPIASGTGTRPLALVGRKPFRSLPSSGSYARTSPGRLAPEAAVPHAECGESRARSLNTGVGTTDLATSRSRASARGGLGSLPSSSPPRKAPQRSSLSTLARPSLNASMFAETSSSLLSSADPAASALDARVCPVARMICMHTPRALDLHLARSWSPS